MRLKAKLAKLEGRLGVEDCPHCGLPLLPLVSGDADHPFTDEERLLLLRDIFQRFYKRDDLLYLLAGVAPALRREVADVYPLSADEQQLVAETTQRELAKALNPAGA